MPDPLASPQISHIPLLGHLIGRKFETTSPLASPRKRKRTSLPSNESSQLTPLSSQHTPPTSKGPIPPLIPPTALLYHLATTAHHASQSHLQQALIPSTVTCGFNAGYPPMTIPNYTSQHPIAFQHDPQAASKALGLQVLALDLLKAGLGSGDLSDKERVAFGLEFCIIGLKVLSIGKTSVKGKEVEMVDLDRLGQKVQEVMSDSVSLARRFGYLRSMCQDLEVLQARFAFFQGKLNVGRRLLKQALDSAPKSEAAHRYALYLLQISHAEADASPLLDLLQTEAESNTHTQIVQLVLLARIRLIFHRRTWDRLHSAFDTLAASIGWPENQRYHPQLTEGRDQPWRAHLLTHYLLLRSLWEGRKGNDSMAKALLKQVYIVVDEASDKGMFSGIRNEGGVMRISLPMPTGHQSILVQLTPPNIAFLMTYLITVTSRRDYAGGTTACKNIVHSQAMQEFENVARLEDIWDVDFSLVHGLADVLAIHQQVAMIRAEVMLEEATALLYRSAFAEVEALLDKIMLHVQKYDLLDTHLAPHICLLHGQYAHLLGYSHLAPRYYRACLIQIQPDSELALIVEICLMGVQGELQNVKASHPLVERVLALAEQCKRGSNASLHAVGFFLASLTDENRTTSKKSLSIAYEISLRGNNNILRCLVFAFTTSTRLYGPVERTLKQLETGRDATKSMGGRDRPDGVGQVNLGIWFAYQLKEYYRREGMVDEHIKTKESLALHIERVNEISRIKTRFMYDDTAPSPMMRQLGHVGDAV